MKSSIRTVFGQFSKLVKTGQKVYPSVAKKALPKPPVPDLSNTLSNYLNYAKVISSPEQFANTQNYVAKFAKTHGNQLQQKLRAVAEEEPNWVNKYWLPDMYLNQRFCLPVNSNPAYIFPKMKFESPEDHLKYAACLIRGFCTFKDLVDNRKIPQELSSGREKVPLCMEQYYRIFSSYREPSYPSDILHTKTQLPAAHNQHIIVMCNNQAFLVKTAVQGEALSQVEIQYQLEQVSKMAHNRCESSVLPVSIFTSANRDKATQAIQMLMENASNRVGLECVMSSSFVVCLDKATKTTNNHEANNETQMAHEAAYMLHGGNTALNACNRWYDKTFQLLIAADGVNGVNIEHSVAEGIAIIALGEHALKYVQNEYGKKQIAEPTKKIKPIPLTWYVSEDLKNLIREMEDDKERLCRDVDFQVLLYQNYGKGFIKANKMSPDAFIQMTLQLAYYRTHGHLVSSYESASVRRFKDGRVDNIRSATPECLAWAQAMHDPKKTKDERKKLFQIALKRQTQVMIENITGNGIDNHMVALKEVASEDGELPELFSDPVYKEAFRFPFSTSQVGTSISETFLCYGAVTPDGYGCAYNPTENLLIFAFGSFYSCPKTDSTKLRDSLRSCLDDMKDFVSS